MVKKIGSRIVTRSPIPKINDLATVAPDWLRSWVPEEWFERYGRAVEEYGIEPRFV